MTLGPAADGPPSASLVHHFTDVVRWTFILWIGLAVLAAYRVGGGENVFGRRRRSDH